MRKIENVFIPLKQRDICAEFVLLNETKKIMFKLTVKTDVMDVH